MSKNTIQVGTIGMGKQPYLAEHFSAQLEACDPNEPLVIEFHSEGGAVWEGFKIHNLIKDWPGKTIGRIQVAAFSIASYAVMACDEIEIAQNGFFMIHNPWSSTEGDHKAHEQNAKLLAELKASMIESYVGRTNLDPADVQAMMDEESYIGATQAIELGFADRVIEKVAPGRQFDGPAQPASNPQNHMPTFVFASMYGRSDGNPPASTPKEKPMSQKPVAATVRTIKAAFPKASNDFIVLCMDKEMSMDDVGEEYAKAMENENEELVAKVAAMEAENAELKAKIAAMEGEEEEVVAVEEELQPAAKVTGVNPVAHVASTTPVAEADDWDNLVQSFVDQGKTRQQAVILANRKAPKLREAIVAQANGQPVA